MQPERGRVSLQCFESVLFCACCLSQDPGEASCHFGGEQSYFEGTGRQNCISHSLMWAAIASLIVWLIHRLKKKKKKHTHRHIFLCNSDSGFSTQITQKRVNGSTLKWEGHHFIESFLLITESNTGHTDSEESYFCVTLKCSANNPTARNFTCFLQVNLTCLIIKWAHCCCDMWH